jgi:alkylation response protein AidB-like acyl-CoA dehydrogenase
MATSMNFDLPADLEAYIKKIDTFINAEILPLQHQDDNNRFFDHRRESARTQWDNGGLPRDDWEAILVKAKKLADKAGFFRFALVKEYGGQENPNQNLWMCAIRYFLSSHPVYGGGVSLANDLQNEHSVVGNFPDILMVYHFGTKEQRDWYIPARLEGKIRTTFGLTEIYHGSDATHMDTVAKACKLADGSDGFVINGNKKWQTGMHHATHCLIFARTSGKAGAAKGITAFIVPRSTPGIEVDSFQWTLNMPTDHATVYFKDVKVPASAVLGPYDNGLAIAQTFTHENRIRQASSSCGAAMYCIQRSVEWANNRKVFGKALSTNQGIQFPLVELATQAEMLRLLIMRTAWEMDNLTNSLKASGQADAPWIAIEKQLGHKISMCNYYANRLCTQAADRAIQVHGGMGYSRHYPFEHIWRHFRRYRITEGSEEVQMRKVGAYLFGFKSTGVSEKGTDEELKGTPTRTPKL